MSDVSPTPQRSPAARMRAHSASMATSMTALSASGDAAAGGEAKAVSPGPLDRFAGLAAALEHAAAAIARLDALSTGHPLLSAWLWRTRLEAVRRHAGCDGRAIDPWHLAAMIEGVRFRMDRAAAIIDRGAIFEAARHAFQLWGRLTRPDAEQSQAIVACQGTAADRRQGVRRRDATANRRLGGRIPRRTRRGGGSRHRFVASVGAAMVCRACRDPRPTARFTCRGRG